MNTRIQKLIVFTFLLIGSALLFTNCQTELNDEITDAKKAIVVKHISLKDLQKKGNYAKILKNVSKAIKQNNANNIEKGLFATDSTFYVHTDLIYETSTDSITNYTFRIERAALDSLKIENLIISKNNNTNDIQLRIIEFIKNEDVYNTRLYAIETNNINLDALQNKDQGVYIYGQLIIVDDCVSVTYTPCDGRGTADGHDVTSNCHGSATTLNFERCASITAEGGGGGSGGGTTGGGTTTNPDNTPINGGFPGGSHHPNTNIGSFAIIDQPDYYGSFLKSSDFSLGTAERNWLEAHPIEETVLKDFINENEASAQANAFGEAAVETWMEGGNVNFEEFIRIIDEMDKKCQANIITDVLFLDSELTDLFFINLVKPTNTSIAFVDYPPGFGLEQISPEKIALTRFFRDNHPEIGDFIVIEFNDTFLDSATDLGIFVTSLHEMLHAYLNNLYHENQLLNVYPQYGTLNNAMINFEQNQSEENEILLAKEAHNIYIDFIDLMATSIIQYTQNNNISGIDFNYAKKLVWGSLVGTEVFTNNLDEIQQNLAITLSNYETTNHPNAKGQKSCY